MSIHLDQYLCVTVSDFHQTDTNGSSSDGSIEVDVHLQVHWPVGQAHEVPQLHEHPGPIASRSAFRGRSEQAGY